MSNNDQNTRFIEGGYWLAREAIERKVIEEVNREFAADLRSSGYFGRWLLRIKIHREIERRIEAQAPRDALY